MTQHSSGGSYEDRILTGVRPKPRPQPSLAGHYRFGAKGCVWTEIDRACTAWLRARGLVSLTTAASRSTGSNS